MNTTEKKTNERTYKVIVKNSQGQMLFTHAFLSQESAYQIFIECQSKYSYYHKISIEAILL